jgi:serine/threonine protein kinase
MKRAILKANGKKKKYFQRIEKNRKDEDSDGYLSSDDEEEVSDSMISKVIENQYIIIKYLGRGSFSKTWMVYDYLEDQFLALKLFENNFFEEFQTEMFNFQKLKGSFHNNIIKFYGSIEYKKDGNLMKGLLLELLGDSIEALLDEQYDNKITSNTIKTITRDILNGLDFLHNKGLVHNDMKLDNILISKPNKKMEEYIGKIQDLKINQYYLEQINELTPVEIQLLDKKKRKMVKRKIREKANKVTVKKFRNDIIKINNSSLENLKLSIEEIQTTEEPTKQEIMLEENNKEQPSEEVKEEETTEEDRQETTEED